RDPLHLLQQLDSALDLPGLAGLVPKPLDESRDVGDLALLILVSRLLDYPPILPLHEVETIVSAILRDLPVRQFVTGCDHPAEEVAVVRYHYDCALVGFHVALQ